MAVNRRNFLIAIGVLIVMVGVASVFYFIKMKPKEEETPTKIVEVDSIDEYGYVLEDRDTDTYKAIFEDLQKVLKDDVIDYEKYVEDIAKLYIVDLYTMENKINKYDIGSLDFVHPDAKANFELKVQDTIYKYIEDNTYGKRTQSLPSVSKIEVTELKGEKVKVGENSLDGYVVKLKWEYVKDDGYDKEATLSLVRKDKKVYVVKETTKDGSKV